MPSRPERKSTPFGKGSLPLPQGRFVRMVPTLHTPTTIRPPPKFNAKNESAMPTFAHEH